MRKIIALVLSILLGNQVFGQISNLSLNGVPARLMQYQGIDGSPYLYDAWGKATIGTNNSGLKENISYRFNVYENEFEVINEAGNTILLTKDYVDFAYLERPPGALEEGMLPKLLFKKGFEFVKGIGFNQFVNVITEGKNYTLIRRYSTDLVTPPQNSYAGTVAKTFMPQETFYLIDQLKNVRLVRNRNSNILGALEESSQDAAKKLVKESKFDLSREDHLVRFFQILNEN